MEYVQNFLHAVVNNGFSWKNLAFFILFILGVRSLYKAISTGDLDTGWLLSGDINKAPVAFWFKVVIAVLYTAVCGYLALGFGNQIKMFNFF